MKSKTERIDDMLALEGPQSNSDFRTQKARVSQTP
jgi:hypothetical protein